MLIPNIGVHPQVYGFTLLELVRELHPPFPVLSRACVGHTVQATLRATANPADFEYFGPTNKATLGSVPIMMGSLGRKIVANEALGMFLQGEPTRIEVENPWVTMIQNASNSEMKRCLKP